MDYADGGHPSAGLSASSQGKRYGGTPSLSSRIQSYTSLLSATNLLPGHTVADLYSLRHLSIQGGVPDQPSWLRPQAWRVLLGYLPPEKREWPQTLASRRHEYAQFLVDFLQPLTTSNQNDSSLPGRVAERDVLLDQLYKDIVRSRKNGFAFYHSDVPFPPVDDPTLATDRTRAQALDFRQALLHRLRAINHDYAAVTAPEVEGYPINSTPQPNGTFNSSNLNTPTITASAPPATSDSSSVSIPTPTIMLPAPELDLSSAPASAPVPQPSFESIFDPAQHSSTPAGDAPAPFAADAVALPPPPTSSDGEGTGSSELDDLTKILDEQPEPQSAGTGGLLLHASSLTEQSPLAASEQTPNFTLSPPPPASLITTSSATFASVVDNVRDAITNFTTGDSLNSDGPVVSAEAVDQAVEDMPTPQQAMLEARKAHQDEIQDAQDDPAESTSTDSFLHSLNAFKPSGSTEIGSARSDGSSSASRTPLASSVPLPPAHTVEGFAPTPIPPPLLVGPSPISKDSNHQLRDRRWHAILRMLYVYALLNPSVGYIQGLNEVAFVIYWVMSQSRRSSLNAGGNVTTPTTPRQKPLSPDYMTEGLSGRGGGPSSPAGLSPSTPLGGLGLGTEAGADGQEEADELDLEADAFWCFSNLIGSVRELYEFDGIDHAVAGLRVRNSRGAGAGDVDGLTSPGQGWSRGESGMAGALRRLSLRLRWVDEPLWAELRRASLDPRLPYYSFRWLACLLSNELALPSVVRLWDALLGEQDSSYGAGGASATPTPGAVGGLAESSKVEFLIDVCAALLVRLREPLMRPPPVSSRRVRARRNRTIRRRTPSGRATAEDTDSDAPSIDEEEEEQEADNYDAMDFAQDDFAHKMHILQTFPDSLDLDVDVGPLLEQAYIFRQRRLAADLTGDGPPTVDDEDAMRDGGAAAPTPQSLGQRASSAWRDWRTRSTVGTVNGETGSGTGETSVGTPSAGTPSASVRSPSGWLSSIGTRFASMPTPSSAGTTERESLSAQTSPVGLRLGGSLQRYAEALQSSDAAANLSKASTNLTAKALAMSASWNQRAPAGDVVSPPPPAAGGWTDNSSNVGRASTLGAAQSSLLAKARSVSASYMATMSNAPDARRPSTGDDSDSSFGQHPTRWSRPPVPDFPLPDPNDSDGRRDARLPVQLGGGHMRAQSPEGSDAGSESSAGRRMLPSLRMAAKLGLFPQDARGDVAGGSSGARAAAGPKPLMLSSSARPPRDASRRERGDISSDLEMSRKVSSGPMAGHVQSPISSPRDSVSSHGAGPRAAHGRTLYASRTSRSGHDSSRGGSESGGDYETISSPPSEDGSRRSSMTPGVGRGGGGRGSVSSMTTASRVSGRASGQIMEGEDGLVLSPGGLAQSGGGSGVVPIGKFARAQARTVGHGGAREGSIGSMETPPPPPPSAWKRPIASSSDVPLVRSVDVSLRTRPRRRRQDTGSSLESNSATPTDPRNPLHGSEDGVSGGGDLESSGFDTPLVTTPGVDSLVRYQLSDEPVGLDRSGDTVVGETQTISGSTSTTSATRTASSGSKAGRYRSRLGSNRSFGSVASKRNSVKSVEEVDGVTYVPAADVLGAGANSSPADAVDVGPPLMEHEEDEEEQGYPSNAAPVGEEEAVQPLRPRLSPNGGLLTIDTGMYGHGYGGSVSPSPLPSPGPEAGMFVSADSLLAELGAELEGLSSSSSSPGEDFGRDPSELGWAGSKGQVAPGGDDNTRRKRLSDVKVPMGTFDAIGSALTHLEED
ncbi:hypothetical protein A4X13_0g4053 [Tilletia indica]|uniref:Uncharacterized protein n=1 Tax=Tilletia indica TaxID=43049 RepID=A0A177T9M5_9BASI|nr:hypothetical protein A4X13_0g4053 [Tilletia indica]